MTAIDPAEITRAAEVSALKAHKMGSSLPLEDLRQIAWLAVLDSTETFNPSYGVPFAGYACQAGIYACRRASWASIKDHVKGVLLISLEPEFVESSEQIFDRKEWKRRVRKEVRKILAEPEVEPQIIRLFLKTSSAKEIAKEKNQPIQSVYNKSSELRRKLKSSKSLETLWSEIT